MFLYRKVRKLEKKVYNVYEIKNCITKERRGLRHDVVCVVFCFCSVRLHYLTLLGLLLLHFRIYPERIAFRYCSNSAVFM